jgi:hypothetical protein
VTLSSNKRPSAFQLYRRADSSHGSGLSIIAFQKLWVACSKCKRVLCRDSVFFHCRCPPVDWTAAPRTCTETDDAVARFLLNNCEQLEDVLRQRVWHGETRCIVSEYSTCRVQTREEYVNTSMLLIL